jgi:hypothetical protein
LMQPWGTVHTMSSYCLYCPPASESRRFSEFAKLVCNEDAALREPVVEWWKGKEILKDDDNPTWGAS